MNSKTAARMKRAQKTFARLEVIARREIVRLEKIQHIKPEDFRAAVALRDVADLCGRYAKTAALPHDPTLPFLAAQAS